MLFRSPLDVNLSDMLFAYGMRVNSCIVMDEQCLQVPVDVAAEGQEPEFRSLPWHYAPLLLVSSTSPITRGIGPIMSALCSAVDLVGTARQLHTEWLVSGSASCRIIPTPARVDLSPQSVDDTHYDIQYVPIGATLEGPFTSAFAHRLLPDSINTNTPRRNDGVPTRQAIIATSSIMRGEQQQGQPLPLGYDRFSGHQFSNRQLLVNTVLYLAGHEQWIDPHNRNITLRLLSRQTIRRQATLYRWLCVGLPLALLALFAIAFNTLRRKR